MTRSTSDDIERLETARTRKPADIYDFWNDVATYRITSADEELTYDGNVYEPAYIGRQRTSQGSQLTVSKLSINIDKLQTAVSDYLTAAPLDETWVRVLRIFRNQSPPEAMVYFIGTVGRVRVKGRAATLECDGLEKVLGQVCPRLRYQRLCPLSLYGPQCGVDKATFEASVDLSAIASDLVTLTSVDFGLQSAGYWTYGWLEFNGYKRMVVSHSGNEVVIRHYIPGLTDSDTVTVYPGCDKQLATCRDKFSNLNGSLDTYFGFPYMPFDNPTLW